MTVKLSLSAIYETTTYQTLYSARDIQWHCQQYLHCKKLVQNAPANVSAKRALRAQSGALSAPPPTHASILLVLGYDGRTFWILSRNVYPALFLYHLPCRFIKVTIVSPISIHEHRLFPEPSTGRSQPTFRRPSTIDSLLNCALVSHTNYAAADIMHSFLLSFIVIAKTLQFFVLLHLFPMTSKKDVTEKSNGCSLLILFKKGRKDLSRAVTTDRKRRPLRKWNFWSFVSITNLERLIFF